MRDSYICVVQARVFTFHHEGFQVTNPDFIYFIVDFGHDFLVYINTLSRLNLSLIYTRYSFMVVTLKKAAYYYAHSRHIFSSVDALASVVGPLSISFPIIIM